MQGTAAPGTCRGHARRRGGGDRGVPSPPGCPAAAGALDGPPRWGHWSDVRGGQLHRWAAGHCADGHAVGVEAGHPAALAVRGGDAARWESTDARCANSDGQTGGGIGGGTGYRTGVEHPRGIHRSSLGRGPHFVRQGERTHVPWRRGLRNYRVEEGTGEVGYAPGSGGVATAAAAATAAATGAVTAAVAVAVVGAHRDFWRWRQGAGCCCRHGRRW